MTNLVNEHYYYYYYYTHTYSKMCVCVTLYNITEPKTEINAF